MKNFLLIFMSDLGCKSSAQCHENHVYSKRRWQNGLREVKSLIMRIFESGGFSFIKSINPMPKT